MRSRTKSTKSIAFSLVVFMLLGLLAGFSNTHLVVSAFVPVSYITLSSCIATAGTQFTLKAAVSPDFATNQNITWTVVDGEATGATIVDNAVLHTTADGSVKVRATVSDGSGYGQDFYTTFTITVGKAKIANVYPRKTYPESPRPKIKPEQDLTQSQNAADEFTAGVYTVGQDIKAGTYDIVWVAGSGSLSVYDENGRFSVYEIFGDTSRGFYIQEYKNAKLEVGGHIEVKGSLKVKLILK